MKTSLKICRLKNQTIRQAEVLQTPCAMSECQSNFVSAETVRGTGACSYLALQFAPVKSQCLARVDLHIS